MFKQIFEINQQGRAHKTCEDAIYININTGVYITADGVSNSRFGGEGAAVLADEVGPFLGRASTKQILAADSVSKIRRLVTDEIHRILQTTAEERGCEVRDLASTFIAAVEADGNTIVVLHAGDGAVFAIPNTIQSSSPCIISYPDNDNEGRVFEAGCPHQINRLRVLRLNKQDYKAIILGTDGFTDAYLLPRQNAFAAYDLDDVYNVQSNEELKQLVQENHLNKCRIGDDISAIILKISNGTDYPNPAVKAVQPEYKGKNGSVNNNTVSVESNGAKSREARRAAVNPKSAKRAKAVIFAAIIAAICFTAVFAIGKCNAEIKAVKEELAELSAEVDEISGEYDDLKQQFDAMLGEAGITSQAPQKADDSEISSADTDAAADGNATLPEDEPEVPVDEAGESETEADTDDPSAEELGENAAE